MGKKINENCEPLSVKVAVAACMLGVSKGTIRKMIERGELPFIAPEIGPILISVRDLKNYINNKKRYRSGDGVEEMAAKMLMSMKGGL